MDIRTAIGEQLECVSQGRARRGISVSAQADVFAGRPVGRQPLLLCASAPEQWPTLNTREIHDDPEAMLCHGLSAAAACVLGGREAVPSVRANMGCGIVAALFGLTQELYDDKMPWLREHLSKGQILEMTKADLKITPEFSLALGHMEYAAQRLDDSGCMVYPLDIQGAFDLAHLVYGDDIFYDVYDDPDFVHHLMELCAEAIGMAFEACLKRMPGSDETVAHYNALAMPRALGGLKLSEDTSTLLRREHIDEFVRPYLHKALARAGGGYVHYCGKNPHLYRAVMEEPLVHALNFGNPEMQDMERVLAELAASGRLYYGFCDHVEDSRLLRASRRENGTFALLLQKSVRTEDAARAADLWDAEVERALHE